MKSKKLIISFLVATMVVTALMPVSGAWVKDFEDRVLVARYSAAKEEPAEICSFSAPEDKEYKAKVVSIRRERQVKKGEDFKVKIYILNEGNMPWFSYESSCLGPKAYLGTDVPRDRSSVLFNDSDEYEDNNWVSDRRIAMDQLRVEPGEIASFTFWNKAGNKDDVIKEYLTPVLEGIAWLDEAKLSYEVIVGDIPHDVADLRDRINFAYESGSVFDINMNGSRQILIDLSDQMGYVKLDDRTIREFQVSTGAAKTPTPVGEYTIKLKQDVRIGGKSPHYIMPNFMWFRDGGYGIHSLPSLGSSSLRSKIRNLQASGKPVPTSLYHGDTLWTEAVSHIGVPVSHGCVRLLPEDSDFAFSFLQVGDKVKVQW